MPLPSLSPPHQERDTEKREKRIAKEFSTHTQLLLDGNENI